MVIATHQSSLQPACVDSARAVSGDEAFNIPIAPVGDSTVAPASPTGRSRAFGGYVVGDEAVVQGLGRAQTPWSVSTPAIAATVACTRREAVPESLERARTLSDQREFLEAGLRRIGLRFVPSCAPFVLVRVGEGGHGHLRVHGIAARRADTFPGLDDSWVRVAVRPPDITRHLLAALTELTASKGDSCDGHC